MTVDAPGRMNKTVFVVVPIFNEGPVIESTLKPLIDRGYSVVAVDDGSADDTWAAIRSLPVYSLRHAINLGQGASLQTGTAFALSRGAEFVVHFDADGQHNPDDIEVLLDPLRKGEADVALGSRFLRDADRRAVPGAKRLLLRTGRVVNGVLTGTVALRRAQRFSGLDAGGGGEDRASREPFRPRERDPRADPSGKTPLRRAPHGDLVHRAVGRQGAADVELDQDRFRSLAQEDFPMRPVQFILIVLLGLGTYLYFNRLRSGILDRMMVLLFAVLGALMTIVPDFTTRVANLVGVGRGVDLFFYLSILGLAFMCLLLYSRIRQLESSITELARALAVKKANDPDEPVRGGGRPDGPKS